MNDDLIKVLSLYCNNLFAYGNNNSVQKVYMMRMVIYCIVKIAMVNRIT